ncbi:MAG: hypothetical protein JJE03_06080 [Peptostreptococcaceae bacterium]|nr:hypothetical protein [Peptostreptococcaceae bacterium]
MIEGMCKHCGQMRFVEARDTEEANAKVSLSCSCDEGAQDRKLKKMNENLDKLCGSHAEEYQMKPVEEDVYELLKGLCILVNEEAIAKVAISVDYTTITIYKKNENVILNRKKMSNYQLES